MYARVQRIKRKDGHVDEYVQILESYWKNGSARQKVVANLGNKRVLQSQFKNLLAILNPSLRNQIDSIEPTVSVPYGVIFVVHELFRALGLWGVLDRCSRSAGFADRVAVLVANRLSSPSSEHGLAPWLETVYAVDRRGVRILPVWKKNGRVKVDLKWLKPFYGALDSLIRGKEAIEKTLYFQLRDLFHMKVDVVFYDVTSTYFEGEGPSGLAFYGHSRDGKSQNRQVLVGVVMVNGFPMTHHVFEGNTLDHETVEAVVKDLEKRFDVGRIIFVGDRGMVTVSTLSLLKEEGHGYVVGLKRRRRGDVIRYIEAAVGPGRVCPVGITVGEKTPVPLTRVWEVPGEEEGMRVFVVHSEEREAYERAMREKSMARVREELEKLKERVAQGNLTKLEKIGEAVSRILARNHGRRYYDWRLSPERGFEYFEHPVHFEREKKIEGRYFIQTEEKDFDAVEAVCRYKELSEVERGFRSLKDVLEMRPIYHRRPERVRGHIFVAALALLLERVLERKLKRSGSDLSVADALCALKTVGVVEFDVGGEKKMGVSVGSPRAREVLGILGLKKAHLPNG